TSVPSRWLGTIAPVRPNQKRDSPVSTLPLSRIGVGRTTSKALIRSDATIANRSSSMRYRSRTLPERRNRSAVSIGRGLSRGSLGGALGCAFGGDQRIEPRDHHRHMAQVAGVVEARVELGEAERAGDDRLERQQLAQRAALVRGRQRGALDHLV